MRDFNSFSLCNRPFPHYAPVSKHKEMKTRLGWTISYKSLYFVHPSLELVPLFTGMRERSIAVVVCLWRKTLCRAIETWHNVIQKDQFGIQEPLWKGSFKYPSGNSMWFTYLYKTYWLPKLLKVGERFQLRFNFVNFIEALCNKNIHSKITWSQEN